MPYTVLIGIRTSWRKWGQNALRPHHFLDSYEQTHLMMFLVSCFSKTVRYHDVRDSQEWSMGERFRRWKRWGVLLIEQFREPHWLRQCRLYFLKMGLLLQFSSVQFSSSVVSDSFRPHGLQRTRPPWPSPTPGVYSNSLLLHPPLKFSFFELFFFHCDFIRFLELF